MENFTSNKNEKVKNHLLTKSCYVTGTRCSKALFLQKKSPKLIKIESLQDRKVKREGAEVGAFARLQFPGGVLIDTLDTDQALDETKRVIGRGALSLFEAAFMAQGVLIRADILTRTSIDSAWQLYEVKATTYRSVDASSKSEYSRDLALQAWVLQECGIELAGIFLMHLNHECSFPEMDNLFKVIDYNQEIGPLLENISIDIQSLQKVLLSDQHPKVGIGQHCEKPRECQFNNICWKDIPAYSVFNIPRALNKWKLLEENRFSAAQLVDADFNSEKQKRALRCYQTNQPFYDLQVAHALLETWTYPISYFDLEAISYPIPRYNKSRPYQDLPFQFSCHIQRFSEAELEHREFLFDQDADPRQAFIDEMLKTLPTEGSIVVYHQTYEISKLKELAKDFPQHAASINLLLPRIVDLKKVIEESVYHPEFQGSYSIKKVAPVLLGQSVSYERLAVGDGMEAVCRYQELIELSHNDQRRDDIHKHLLEYCKQDTYLMVLLHKWCCNCNPFKTEET